MQESKGRQNFEMLGYFLKKKRGSFISTAVSFIQINFNS
jgi:hypothetical protein